MHTSPRDSSLDNSVLHSNTCPIYVGITARACPNRVMAASPAMAAAAPSQSSDFTFKCCIIPHIPARINAKIMQTGGMCA